MEKDLEKIIEETKIPSITDYTSEHPVIFSPLGSLTTIIARILPDFLEQRHHSNDLAPLIGTGILGLYPGYKVLKTFGEYTHKQRDIFRTRGITLTSKIYNWFLDNYHLVGLTTGSLVFSLGDKIEGIKIETLNERLIAGSLASIATTAALKLNKYLQNLRYRNEKDGESKSLWRRLITNPLTTASAGAAFRFYQLYDLFEKYNFSFRVNDNGLREIDRPKGIFYAAVNSLATFIAIEYLASLSKAAIQKETRKSIKLRLKLWKRRIQKKREEVIAIQDQIVSDSI